MQLTALLCMWPLPCRPNVFAVAEPIGLSAYIVGLPCAVGAVAAILLVVLIIACVCYYHKNKVVVISVSCAYTTYTHLTVLCNLFTNIYTYVA